MVDDLMPLGIGIEEARPENDRFFGDAFKRVEPLNVAAAAKGRHGTK